MTPDTAKAIGFALDAVDELRKGLVANCEANIKAGRELIATPLAFAIEGCSTPEEDAR